MNVETMRRNIMLSPNTEFTKPHSKPTASIDCLPTELLLRIFKIVYVNTRSPRIFYLLCLCIWECSCDSRPYETKWSEWDDLLSPRLFPYALATVCTRWRDVMLLVPEFWTRIVILIDSKQFSLSRLREELESSQNLLINVNITMHESFTGKEDEENSRVRDVTALLHPHLHRCQAIHYNVLYPTSLPPMSLDHYALPKLRQLRLDSRQCSASPDGLQYYIHRMNELQMPSLEKLTINGWDFIELYKNDPQWMRHILHLSISNFRPVDGGRFSFHDVIKFVSGIPRLTSLTLNNVEFDFEMVSNLYSFSDYSHFGSLSSLGLSDLSARLTAGIFAYLAPFYISSITIKHCPLNEVGY
jgi:F-box-like